MANIGINLKISYLIYLVWNTSATVQKFILNPKYFSWNIGLVISASPIWFSIKIKFVAIVFTWSGASWSANNGVLVEALFHRTTSFDIEIFFISIYLCTHLSKEFNVHTKTAGLLGDAFDSSNVLKTKLKWGSFTLLKNDRIRKQFKFQTTFLSFC